MAQNSGYATTVFTPSKNRGVQLIQKVAIYCRVSTADQACERQERDLKAFAHRAGFEVVGIWKEVASGTRDQRLERRRVMDIARDRRIDAVLVTELTRWGRSTVDLMQTLNDLQAWNVSLIAQTGLQFDLGTPSGKLVASMMASLAEFERDLLRERIRSGFASAKAKGKTFGRRPGQRPKSDRKASQVLHLHQSGKSYRVIAKEVNLSVAIVMGIVHRQQGPV